MLQHCALHKPIRTKLAICVVCVQQLYHRCRRHRRRRCRPEVQFEQLNIMMTECTLFQRFPLFWGSPAQYMRASCTATSSLPSLSALASSKVRSRHFPVVFEFVVVEGGGWVQPTTLQLGQQVSCPTWQAFKSSFQPIRTT